ncbi:protein-disulfide reductase DsbD domain-containing protein [Yoonia sp.]|uniref:protein-disulfide reductase DsbD domain-containing protein n=1 Tax=Yoonia sp. TaxID=2212373 RepID=UPI003F6BED17
MTKQLAVFLALLLAPVALSAQTYDDLARIEVLPGWRMDDGTHMAGLRITLKPGWKTYWRAPGDAGIPPHFNFAGSDNISTVTPHWPVPVIFDQNGQRSIGYHDGVVFPLKVAAKDANAPLHLAGQIDIGVCEEICIPVSLPFDAALPADGQRDAAITAALINRPLTGAEAVLGPATCHISPISDGLRVVARLGTAQWGPSEVVIIETGDADIWVSEADVAHAAGELKATVDMVHMTGSSFALDRSQIKITLLGPARAVELQGCQAD